MYINGGSNVPRTSEHSKYATTKCHHRRHHFSETDSRLLGSWRRFECCSAWWRWHLSTRACLVRALRAQNHHHHQVTYRRYFQSEGKVKKLKTRYCRSGCRLRWYFALSKANIDASNRIARKQKKNKKLIRRWDSQTWLFAHFGLPWVRPWNNRGKCHMDGKKMQCLSNASQNVPIFNRFPVIQPVSSKVRHFSTFCFAHFGLS